MTPPPDCNDSLHESVRRADQSGGGVSDLSQEAVKHHVKTALWVFAALAALTVVTVAVSYLRLAVVPAVCAALLIASFKSSLVAGFFMHLISEKKIIFWVLAFTAFCFLALMVLMIYAAR